LPLSSQLEILDLRHFSASQLRPLLQDETQRWNRRLQWDYTRAASLLLEYLDGRILPGYVALRGGQVVGYAFCVFEASKAVIGDLYVFQETEAALNPTCDTLLYHLIELLQATPGVDRVESQLLMFPAGALHGPFFDARFRSYPRLFMLAPTGAMSALHRSGRSGVLQTMEAASPRMERTSTPELPSHLQLLHWQPEFYDPAATLIHRCYTGHMDSNINDQYRTLHGAQRFLHNIIRFPGCGVFDAEHSFVLRDRRSSARGGGTSEIAGLILCSRVRPDTGHITQLCIDPALRGLGLGHLLLQHCAHFNAQRGVTHLSLTVTEANIPALRLYEELGFSTLHRFDAMVWDKQPPP
jgi:ribosomal protein S18 acetylase RimI-like enzyme